MNESFSSALIAIDACAAAPVPLHNLPQML
jgi:hypothetical protein